MNHYINLNRIEFVITHACSGSCRHCSNGDMLSGRTSVDLAAAQNTIRCLTDVYPVQSVMTFGGEPMLYTDTVCGIHRSASRNGVTNRQLITNGYFSTKGSVIDEAAKKLCDAGVNDVLLSVDVFHQESIPLEPVERFAAALIRNGIPSLRVHPAWVINRDHDNPLNRETRRLIHLFAEKGIPANEGNIVFPSGNAVKYLSEYFPPRETIDLSRPCGSEPYTERPDKVSSLSVNPNGDIIICAAVIGNMYQNDIYRIIQNYNPYQNPALRAVLTGGVTGLLDYAWSLGMVLDISDCGSACGICRKVMTSLTAKGS